ncbi:diguanylate cyclase (GGDEF) domain-containing protein [Devosia crocina]|uniref:diguanylate cyclase n=1 Tax=Devosia crocina TaxID=429728 RepID=A0A1I7MXB2_9HYPH|nr:GGDEF domain-containing protein [Devosia crocina]SFV27051.1 diguanylate cyclase (GGDEF) domain-containing protein [Devosia crocina]
MTSPRTVASLQSWSSVAKWTVFGPIACVIVSLVWNALTFSDLGAEALRRALISATILPLLLAIPLFFYLSMRLRGLAITNRKLGLVARTDSLTSCLNRGAFTARVETILADDHPVSMGALLIIDADNFKAINDLYGHDCGDEALTILARSIRSVLKPGDLIGRMGGEEFGVFMPHIDQSGAELAAERIRRVVQLAQFAPRGQPYALTVSIGGAVFADKTDFAELFRIADQRLYGAKHSGRNQAVIVHTLDQPPVQFRRSA